MPSSTYIMSTSRTSKLFGIFLLALVLFNFPIINLFGKDVFIFGLPALYVYFFVVWLVFIIFIARIMSKKD
ncbi:MAG: hypothetical protein AAF573_12300 [Bacteroidota bacterium]